MAKKGIVSTAKQIMKSIKKWIIGTDHKKEEQACNMGIAVTDYKMRCHSCDTIIKLPIDMYFLPGENDGEYILRVAPMALTDTAKPMDILCTTDQVKYKKLVTKNKFGSKGPKPMCMWYTQCLEPTYPFP